MCETLCRGESLTTGGATPSAVCGQGDWCYRVRTIHMQPAVVSYICFLPSLCMCVSAFIKWI